MKKQQRDRSFISCHTSQIPEVVKQVVGHAVKKGILQGYSGLAPMYRGPAGIDQFKQYFARNF